MPIYDNDGTASTQIGKVYDNDGTASYQIGKIWDNDGTASTLVYTAEQMVLNGSTAADFTGVWNASAWNGSSWSWVTGTIPGTANSVGGTNGNVRATAYIAASSIYIHTNHSTVGYSGGQIESDFAIPVNGEAALKVTYYKSGAAHSERPRVGLVTSKKAYSGNPITKYVTGFVAYGDLENYTTETTISIDVSGLSAGNYYFRFHWCTGASNTTGQDETFYITKIVLE